MSPTGKLFSIDFDGTIVEHKYPEIGNPLPNAIETLLKLQEAGAILILNTCREDDNRRKYLTEAVEFCECHGIKFAGINETPLEHEFRSEKYPRRKVYAHVYLDDRNFGGFSWDAVWSTFFPQPLDDHCLPASLIPQ